MCFSATASFTTAAATGAIGVLTLARSSKLGDAKWGPLAAFPLLFSAQQLVEGLLWLDLARADGGVARGALTAMFLLFAEVFWPVFAPLAVFLIEPVGLRRRLIWGCLVCGALVSGFLLWDLIHMPYQAQIRGAHIVYENGDALPFWMESPYLVATTLSLMLSSHGDVRRLGALIFAGFVIASVFFEQAYVSVWCFFAAAASLLVLLHFYRGTELARRLGMS